MAAPAKFLFDTDFSSPHTVRERGLTNAEVTARTTEAEKAGYQRGFQAGRREAEAETARRAMAALEAVAASLASVSGQIADATDRIEVEAIGIALAAARKLSSELIAAEPLAETSALISDCFRHLGSVPHIVLRINEALYDDARARIEAIAARSGFSGRLIILAEPDIAFGDCKIEWADGGITLERAAIEEKITELVQRYLSTRRSAPANF